MFGCCFRLWSRSLSNLGLTYCGKALLASFPDTFRQIATAILLKTIEKPDSKGLPLATVAQIRQAPRSFFG